MWRDRAPSRARVGHCLRRQRSELGEPGAAGLGRQSTNEERATPRGSTEPAQGPSPLGLCTGLSRQPASLRRPGEGHVQGEAAKHPRSSKSGRRDLTEPPERSAETPERPRLKHGQRLSSPGGSSRFVCEVPDVNTVGSVGHAFSVSTTQLRH